MASAARPLAPGRPNEARISPSFICTVVRRPAFVINSSAHRLMFAALGPRQDALMEAIFRAYFREGRDIGNAERDECEPGLHHVVLSLYARGDTRSARRPPRAASRNSRGGLLRMDYPR